ncbi:MAG: hypothetical protein ACREQ9_20895, partial [Candidatus Binatia bacterium]
MSELIGTDFRPADPSSDVAEEPGVFLSFQGGDHPLGQLSPATLEWWRSRVPGDRPLGFVSIDRGRDAGRLDGVVFLDRTTLAPVHSVRIAGTGCPILYTSEGRRLFPPAPLEDHERERWSRVIAALGEATWERLRNLRYAVVGCGR